MSTAHAERRAPMRARIHVHLTEAELAELDAWAARSDAETRGGAVRALIRRGLRSARAESAPQRPAAE